MTWLVAAVAAAVLAWLGARLLAAVQRERWRRAGRARREAERERARRVLREGAAPLERAEVPLEVGERAYHQVRADLLEPEGGEGFRRLASGWLAVTDRAVVFRADDGRTRRIPWQEVERVDVPYADVLVLVSFADGVSRDEVRVHFRVGEPLVLAAHLARFAGFELMLE